MACQLKIFLLLNVLDDLIKVERAHLIHAGIDLDDVTLVVGLPHWHLHHVGGLLLYPLVIILIEVDLSLSRVSFILLALLCLESLCSVPCAVFAGTPLSFVLELADLLGFLVGFLRASVSVDRLHCLDRRHSKVVREEVSVESR